MLNIISHQRNGNQNLIEKFVFTRMSGQEQLARMYRNWNPHTLPDMNVKCGNPFGKQSGSSSKVKIN